MKSKSRKLSTTVMMAQVLAIAGLIYKMKERHLVLATFGGWVTRVLFYLVGWHIICKDYVSVLHIWRAMRLTNQKNRFDFSMSRICIRCLTCLLALYVYGHYLFTTDETHEETMMDCIIYLTVFIILLNLDNYMTVHEFHLNDLQFLKEENQNFKFEQELVTTAG